MEEVTKQKPKVTIEGHLEQDPTVHAGALALRPGQPLELAKAMNWREAAPAIRKRLSSNAITFFSGTPFLTVKGARELGALLGIVPVWDSDVRQYDDGFGGVGFVVTCTAYLPNGRPVGSGLGMASMHEAAYKQGFKKPDGTIVPKKGVDGHYVLGMAKAYAERDALRGVAGLCGLYEENSAAEQRSDVSFNKTQPAPAPAAESAKTAAVRRVLSTFPLVTLPDLYTIRDKVLGLEPAPTEARSMTLLERMVRAGTTGHLNRKSTWEELLEAMRSEFALDEQEADAAREAAIDEARVTEAQPPDVMPEDVQQGMNGLAGPVRVLLMRDELFYDEVLALCRARRELGMAQQALDVLKAKYARAKKAERHAHRALVDASLKWVAQGNNPARLPRGIGFSRRERMDYDADEMLAQAMARGAEDLFVLPPPRLKRADFAAQRAGRTFY